jgi:hypothetical protein
VSTSGREEPPGEDDGWVGRLEPPGADMSGVVDAPLPTPGLLVIPPASPLFTWRALSLGFWKAIWSAEPPARITTETVPFIRKGSTLKVTVVLLASTDPVLWAFLQS